MWTVVAILFYLKQKQLMRNIAWKVSVLGVILVRIFLHSEKVTPYLSVLSPNTENADQNNSEYGHFLRSEMKLFCARTVND